MSFLLDTNVISEPKREKPDNKVIRWLKSVDHNEAYLSALTVGEIKKGAVKLTSGKKKADLQNWLDKLRNRFADRILPITEQTFLVWGQLYGEFEKKGIVRPAFDSLLEATAVEHDLILVTRNVRNFQGSPATLLNPWAD